MRQPAVLILLFIFLSCSSSKSEKQEQPKVEKTGQTTEFEFQKEMHNFGTLQAGEIVMFSFLFTNTGKNNLWINNVDTGCGCMSAEFPEKPLKPGEKGEITVEFDSSGLFGKQMKTITVEANVPKPKHLAIFAEVNNEQLEIKY